MKKSLILLVEDSPLYRDEICRLLESLGQFDVNSVSTLTEAEKFLVEVVPDLAIIDLVLPDGRGTDLLQQRSDEDAFPVVIMSAMGDEPSAVEAMKKGALDYIVKSAEVATTLPRIVLQALQQWDNIRERKRVEKELAESERKYRRLSDRFHTLFDAIADQILLVDSDCTVLWANRAARDELGVDCDGDKTTSCYEVIKGKGERCPDCSCLNPVEKSRIHCFQIENRVVEEQTFSVMGEDGNIDCSVLIFRDITEKVKAQELSIRTGQLAALGELAAGVAHEINNPINGVINCTQLLRNRTESDDSRIEIIDRVLRESNRIAEIVSNLLVFSRDDQQEQAVTDVNQLIDEAMTLVRTQLVNEGITPEIKLDARGCRVRCFARQIEQVVLNLVSNARYALKERYPQSDENKQLKISTTLLELDGRSLVQLEVVDHGGGIPAALIDKVLQPFYTTKPAGDGTGLGLSICHEIIKKHAGQIEIDSQAGESTRIVVTLPAA